MSSAFRDSGCVIMKMISSTSRMSIIGTTLTRPRSPLPSCLPIDMSFFSFLPLGRTDRRCRGSVIAAITRTPDWPCDLDGLLYPGRTSAGCRP